MCVFVGWVGMVLRFERVVRVLYGLDIEVQVDVPDGLSGTTAHGAVHDRRLSSAHLATGRDVQPCAEVSSVEVRSFLPSFLSFVFCSGRADGSGGGWWMVGRPKEHHVYDVLHVIKASFKKQALDEIKEHDCLNKEAYRYVSHPTHPSINPR